MRIFAALPRPPSRTNTQNTSTMQYNKIPQNVIFSRRPCWRWKDSADLHVAFLYGIWEISDSPTHNNSSVREYQSRYKIPTPGGAEHCIKEDTLSSTAINDGHDSIVTGGEWAPKGLQYQWGFSSLWDTVGYVEGNSTEGNRDKGRPDRKQGPPCWCETALHSAFYALHTTS